MAKDAITPKSQSRLRQIIRIFGMTLKADKSSIWRASLAFVLPLAIGVPAGIWLSGGNPLTIILWSVTSLLAAVLTAMTVLSRRAEKVAFANIAGKPGAVGAVLQNSLKRGWRGSEMPVAVNPRTQDAVYRAVGPGGIVLIAEGTRSRVQVLVDDERRKVSRVAQGAPVTVLYVCGDDKSIELSKIQISLVKLKRQLTRAEITAVNNRLKSLTLNLPIPKGVDPTKMRAQRR
jgi:hypothetical protein